MLIFTKSEMAANRVMKFICSWLERKLLLKVNTTKTKVVRPARSKYLGFTFLKNDGEWKVKPTTEKKKKLKKKLSEYLKRGKAIARPLVVTIKRVNEIEEKLNYILVKLYKITKKYKFERKVLIGKLKKCRGTAMISAQNDCGSTKP